MQVKLTVCHCEGQAQGMNSISSIPSPMTTFDKAQLLHIDRHLPKPRVTEKSCSLPAHANQTIKFISAITREFIHISKARKYAEGRNR